MEPENKFFHNNITKKNKDFVKNKYITFHRKQSIISYKYFTLD